MDYESVLSDTNCKVGLKNILLRLANIGYFESFICKRLELSSIIELSWRAIPIYRKEQLAIRDALSCAIDLFLLQGSVLLEELDMLFDKQTQESLLECKVLIKNENLFLSSISCYPVNNILIFSDHAWPKLPHPGYKDTPYDQVMYIGLDSRWLAHATVRKDFNSALDLCTGSGIHAVLAATHTKRVVAVDINQRAAKCTELNAFALGASNVEVFVGDLYEPLGEERFDLITANPPFVPSPVDSLGYRDGGRDGESVQSRIFEGLPRHLAHDGIAQIVTEIGERDGESLVDRLRKWLNHAPMNILVLRLQVKSAANYASSHANTDDTYETYLNEIDEWASNLREHGYKQVSTVLIAIKWSDKNLGEAWGRIEDVDAPTMSIGSAIENIFETENLIRRPDLFEILKSEKLCLSGKIALLEAMELGGSKIDSKAQVKLLGAPLAIAKWVDRDELDILLALKEPMMLEGLANKLPINEKILFDKISLLIKSGFVRLLKES